VMESVRVNTRPVVITETDVAGSLGDAFIASLDDPTLVASLLKHFAALKQKLPGPARADVELPDSAGSLRVLADNAWQIVADALTTGEAG